MTSERLKLPVLTGGPNYWPADGTCKWCGVNPVLEPHSFAILEAGVLESGSSRKTPSSADLKARLSLVFHGAHDDGVGEHRETFADVTIVDDVSAKVFALYFCSTRCLRGFLNFSVDELEREIRRQVEGDQ
jgi:hypothetical protein